MEAKRYYRHARDWGTRELLYRGIGKLSLVVDSTQDQYPIVDGTNDKILQLHRRTTGIYGVRSSEIRNRLPTDFRFDGAPAFWGDSEYETVTLLAEPRWGSWGSRVVNVAVERGQYVWDDFGGFNRIPHSSTDIDASDVTATVMRHRLAVRDVYIRKLNGTL